MKFISSVLILTTLVFSGACNKDSSGEGEVKTLKLTVMHTNDHHGRYWKDRKGRAGMAARLTLVKKIRNEVAASNGHTLLLSGGDINTGTPESDLFDAEPDFKGMNLLKYDAMAVGNHEFDNPRPILMKQRDAASFPFLSANIYYQNKEQRVFQPYMVKEIDGFKIVVVGLTTEDTPNMALDSNVAGLDFKPVIEESKKLIPEIKKKENPDMIIAVTHMGHYPDGDHGTKSPGDITLAKNVQGFNLIVGGHTQKPVFQPTKIGETLIVQAGEWGKYLGRLDFELIKKDGKTTVTVKEAKLISVNYDKEQKEKITEDPEMLTVLSPYYQQAQEKMVEKIGQSDCTLDGDRKVVRKKLAPIGVLVARAQKEKAGADFAVVNGGGIRDSLPQGDITLKDVFQVHPFGNTVITVELEKNDLKRVLEGTLKQVGTDDNGAYPHFDGIEFKHTNKIVSDIKIGGQPVQDGKKYKMAINNYAAQGKEGYVDLRTFPSYVDTGFSDASALETLIRKSAINCQNIQPVFSL